MTLKSEEAYICDPQISTEQSRGNGWHFLTPKTILTDQKHCNVLKNSVRQTGHLKRHYVRI